MTYINLTKLGIKLIRKNVGDINVISEMQKKNLNLGGEQSGHIILGNYMSTGDGILAALKITEYLSNQNIKASKLFDLYKTYTQIKNNIDLNKKTSKKVFAQINDIYSKFKKDYKELRFLVRKSGTEPLLRILVEGSNQVIVNKVSKKLNKNLKKIINEK